MQQARMAGNFVEYMAKSKSISNERLCKIIGCEEHQLQSFFKGRSILSFPSDVADCIRAGHYCVSDSCGR